MDPRISLDGSGTGVPGEDAGSISAPAEESVSTDRYLGAGEIGRGGMGAIYRVWDADLRRELAMKVMLTHRSTQERSASRFLEEAQVTSQLTHPGIVPVHEVGLDSAGRLYFTMKLVSGLTLEAVFSELAKGEGSWTLTRAVGALLRACEAVAYAHEKGVVHRDLKPANIMVGAFGEVYVMDWGLAKILDLTLAPAALASQPEGTITSDRREQASSLKGSHLVTQEGDVVGTPAYMAPEQAAGSSAAIGTKADVYAMGAILYHLLTGRLPRAREGVNALDQSEQPELSAICERAMAERPKDRYASIQDLRSDLQSWLEGRVVRAYESGAVAALRKWIRRNRVLAALFFVALTAVPVIASLTTYGLAQKTEAAQNLRLFELLRYRVDLEEAEASADLLFPAWPENLSALRAWMEDHGRPLSAARDVTESALLEFTRAGRVFRFNGESSHVVVAHSDDLNPGAAGFTCEFWMKGVKAPGLCVAIDKSHGFFDNTGWAFQSSQEGDTIGFLLGGGGALPYLNIRGLPTLGKNLDGRWHHMAGTWDGAMMRLYQDGILQGERSVRTVANNSRDLFFGAAWCGGESGRFFNGELDNITIHARALTQEELLEGASLGPPVERDAILPRSSGGSPEVVAQWRADGNARDSIAGHHGVARGAVFGEQRIAGEEDQRIFLANTLGELTADLDDFALHPHGALQDVGRRIDWATRVEELTVDRFAQRWARARQCIATADGIVASELYQADPIDLVPQIGLVPIGMNPVSKLWEFYHMRSSAQVDRIPSHGSAGEIEVELATGIVFVLLPGGTFLMGADSDPDDPNWDPSAQPDESPVHEVTLEPFFIARHEMTKAQWSRLGRLNRGDDIFPVHDVSWVESTELLERHALSLPTEAQWEYGARAGSHTPWWSGSERHELIGVANFGDSSALRANLKWPGMESDLDDGLASHGRVGSMRANAFGLHDIHGNVLEWCMDSPVAYSSAPRAGDGYRFLGGSGWKSARGGSYDQPTARARSAFRTQHQSWHRAENLGLRAVRRLHRRDERPVGNAGSRNWR